MEDLNSLLMQIIANSPKGDQLANLDSLDGTEKFLIFKPGEKRPYLIEKGKVTFPGEVPTKLSDLDTPSLTGQKGKILVVKQDESGYEHQVLAEVTGVTQQELNDAIAEVEAKIGTSSPNEVTQFITGHQSGLTYQPYAKFIIDGVAGEDTRQVTADAADPTLPRYDVFAIDKATKQIVIIKGTAADPRTYPTVDPLTHLDTGVFIDIPAGATEPAGITGEVIYSEGGEWSVLRDPAFFDIANTENSASGSVAIKTLQPHTNNKSLGFGPPAPIPYADGMELQYKIANIAGGDHYWIVQGFDSKGKMKSAGISPATYDPANTNYQFIAMAIPSGVLVDIRKVMLVSLSNTLEFYLDEVRLSSGGGGVESGVTKEFVLAEDQKLQEQIDNHESRIATLEASSGGAEYISTIESKTASFEIQAADNGKLIRLTEGVVSVPNGMADKYRVIIKRTGNGLVSISPQENVVLEVPTGYVPEINSKFDYIELIKEQTVGGVDYYGLPGALKPGEFANGTTLVLNSADLGLETLGWPYLHKSSDFPQVTTTKAYFFLYSTHHDAAGGGIYWAECDDLNYSNIEVRGQIVSTTNYQAEFPWIMNIPTAESGLADTIFLYYHTNANDPSNTSGAQETHLITSTGGELHTATWANRGKPLGLAAGENHTGYLRIWKRGVNDYLAHHLGVATAGGAAKISTSTDGLTWTRLDTLDYQAPNAISKTFERWSIWPFTKSGTKYGIIYYLNASNEGKFALVTLDDNNEPATFIKDILDITSYVNSLAGFSYRTENDVVNIYFNTSYDYRCYKFYIGNL